MCEFECGGGRTGERAAMFPWCSLGDDWRWFQVCSELAWTDWLLVRLRTALKARNSPPFFFFFQGVAAAGILGVGAPPPIVRS